MEADNVEPGKETSITIETSAKSYVALTAVDQRVGRQSANVVNEKIVEKELESFYFNEAFNGTNRKVRYASLSESNAFLLTNALGGKPDCAVRSGFDDSSDSDSTVTSGDEWKDQFLADSPVVETKGVQETWIFESFQVGLNGHHVLTKTVPEALTSYIITGVSVNEQLGLGIAKPQLLGVMKQFFVELNVPQSLVVGEILTVEVLVCNYHQSVKKANVQLYNDDNEFTIMQPKASCEYDVSDVNNKVVPLTFDEVTPVAFYVKALNAGPLKLRVSAHANLVRDETVRFIDVKPYGLKRNQNRVKFLDLRSKRYDGHYFDVELNNSISSSSVQSEASIIGDLMGPALINIDQLLQV